jgi:hypothetical protein
MPMRHGLTLGEMGTGSSAIQAERGLPRDHDEGLATEGPGFGWPESGWINPSPNAANLNMGRAYAGTVMIEGATVSEGRGTTRPLEVLFGAPDVDAKAVLAEMQPCAPMDGGLRCANAGSRRLSTSMRALVQRFDDPCRRRVLRSRLPPVAVAGTGLQGDPAPVSRLSAGAISL